MSIILPRSGSVAPVYYRGFSSPDLVGFVRRFLRPGMTMLDIGAHAGEHTLVAAHLVGSQGNVHAIEPQPNYAEIIVKNAALNGFTWVTVHHFALSDRNGEMMFTADPHSGGGWLKDKAALTEAFEVQTITLDDFCRKQNLQHIDFMKLDVAGNEFAALKGGEDLLASNCVPRLMAKLYDPRVTWERFGYDSRETVRLLQDLGYALYELTRNGPQAFTGSVRGYSIPLLAIRRKSDMVMPGSGQVLSPTESSAF